MVLMTRQFSRRTADSTITKEDVCPTLPLGIRGHVEVYVGSHRIVNTPLHYISCFESLSPHLHVTI